MAISGAPRSHSRPGVQMGLPRPFQGHAALQQQCPLRRSSALPAADTQQPIAAPPTLHPHPILQLRGRMTLLPPQQCAVLSSPHVWVRGSKRSFSSTPGSAYTCLEAATGRALLRQHMDTTGEEHPLNKLRVVIEPGLGGRAALWWGAAWHSGGSGESEHSARFAEQGMV